jgi:hypothetical protein
LPLRNGPLPVADAELRSGAVSKTPPPALIWCMICSGAVAAESSIRRTDWVTLPPDSDAE